MPKTQTIPKNSADTEVSQKPQIRFKYFNARSLVTNTSGKPKLSSLHLLLRQEIYDIILVSETWLTSKVSDALLLGNSRYYAYRYDRSEKRGGGCCIFILSPLKASRVACDPTVEIVCLDISYEGSRFRCAVFYRAPNGGKDGMAALCRCLSNLRLSSDLEFICAGDANAGKICWDSLRCEDPLQSELLETCEALNMQQLVKMPTRGENILDILIVSDKNGISSVKVSEPFLFSDHCSLNFEIPVETAIPRATTKRIRNFRKGDYEAISYFLSSKNWLSIFLSCNTADEFWTRLHIILLDCVCLFVPLTTISTTSFILPLFLRKLEARKALMFGRYGATSQHYRKSEKYFARSLRKFVVSLEDKILGENDRSRLYAFMKTKRKRNEGLPDMKVGDQVIQSDKGKAEAFSQFFRSVYTSDNNKLTDFPNRFEFPISSIDFDTDKVRKAISALKPKMSMGSDLLPAFFYKKVEKQIAVPLSMMFHLSFITGDIPTEWKKSTVVPIHKKGPKNLINNYRPISKQATVLKIMEKVIINQLVQCLNMQHLFSPRQFGFRPGFSVTKQLLTCLDHWTKQFNHGTDVIFLDFQKAFDSVSHTKILHKLAAYGITGYLYNWFKSYLSGRVQRVQIGDSYSEYSPITSGILQGSCAGPILFLIFINDLPDILGDVEVALFADDVKLYSTHPERIQASLDKINRWCKDWQLTLAEHKCSFIRIGKRQILPPHPYRINESIIQYTTNQRDLGVMLSTDLNLADHYAGIVKKANTASWQVLKSFTSRRPHTMAAAYTIYVRPILETFSQVWNPIKRQDVSLLERVQRRFTHFLYFKCGLPENTPYEERLSFLGLQKLETRRISLDLAFAHQLYFSDSDLSRDILIKHAPPRVVRILCRLDVERHAMGPRRAFFVNRVPQHWNSLPVNIVLTSNNTFKNKVKAILK